MSTLATIESLPPLPKRNRSEKTRISLDLGSDSTVVYVAAPNETTHKRLDLQFFLKALASSPDLLLEGRRPSHRLKSRYAVTYGYQTEDPPLRREHPVYGYTEILPHGHATRELVDFDRYIQEAAHGAANTAFGVEPQKCLFKFIDDIASPFPPGSLLPNAKLIFQSGIGLDREFPVRSGDRSYNIEIHPVEIIKNQVCLILQNFVRPHPTLRVAGQMPEWEDCVVVLTVPNTYSPFHREVLAEAISSELGCEVETITESDAIVFFYLSEAQPDDGLAMPELKDMQQTYLTIDIGKGTTDLSLMTVFYRDAEPEQKALRGLSKDSPAAMKHVYVAARTGRASGGAKMTFILAEFLERLVDLAIVRTLERVEGLTPEQKQALKRVTGTPFRLTTQSRLTMLNETRRLLEFENIVNWFKQEMDISEGVVEIPDYEGDQPAEDLIDYLASVCWDYIKDELKLPVAATLTTQLQIAISDALLRPNSMRPAPIVKEKGAPPPPADEARPIWDEFVERTRAYVTENADEVILELAAAHAEGNDNVSHDRPEAALAWMLGRETGLNASAPKPVHVRTRLILAGQASQFKPLKRRLNEIAAGAGLGRFFRSDELRPQPGLALKPDTTPAAKGKKGVWNKFVGMFGPAFGSRANGKDHLAEHLVDDKLKDGCALGALSWYSSNPVMLNPDYIHGQILVTLHTGGNPIVVDMDRLNGTKHVPLGPDDLGAYDAWNIYYLPTKGQRATNQLSKRRSIMGTLMSCNNIDIKVRPEEDPTSDLVVSTNSGQKIKLKDSLYGAEGARDLREMLWPAMLLDQ